MCPAKRNVTQDLGLKTRDSLITPTSVNSHTYGPVNSHSQARMLSLESKTQGNSNIAERGLRRTNHQATTLIWDGGAPHLGCGRADTRPIQQGGEAGRWSSSSPGPVWLHEEANELAARLASAGDSVRQHSHGRWLRQTCRSRRRTLAHSLAVALHTIFVTSNHRER